MQIRKTKPEKGNKFYIRTANGGYSRCIVGKPTDSNCNVLANCVGYACGRFNEIIGKMKYPYLNCNAEDFIERAKNMYGLKVVSYPTLGGILVWSQGKLQTGADGAGHVAIVERIDSANQIYTSESNYGGTTFLNATRKNTNGRWGIGSSYKFRGCIVNPAIGDVHWEEPKAGATSKPAATTTITTTTSKQPKFPIGTKVIATGKLYLTAGSTTATGSCSKKETKITRFVAGAKHPYNTTGDLGWMDESAFTLKGSSTTASTASKTKTYTVKKGDTLSGIASKLGYKNWKDLYEKNKSVIGSNPNLIKPGQVLKY